MTYIHCGSVVYMCLCVCVCVSFPAALPHPSRHMSGDTLSFRGVTMENTGVYQCNASNQFGYLLANAYVNVLRESPTSLPCISC